MPPENVHREEGKAFCLHGDIAWEPNMMLASRNQLANEVLVAKNLKL